MSAHGSSNTGSKSSTGTASSVPTPANAGIGEDKPKAFDERGVVGKQFTGKTNPTVKISNLALAPSRPSILRGHPTSVKLKPIAFVRETLLTQAHREWRPGRSCADDRRPPR